MLIIALAATNRDGCGVEGRNDFVWLVLRVKLSTWNVSGYFSSDMLYDTHFQNCVDVLFLVSIPGIVLSVDLKCYFSISSDVSFNRLSSTKSSICVPFLQVSVRVADLHPFPHDHRLLALKDQFVGQIKAPVERAYHSSRRILERCDRV